MDYPTALSFLDSLVNYERRAPRRYDTTSHDLEKFAALLARLGSPQDAFPIVHVAGTKGKGSVCAMLAAAFAAAGYKAGLFTSPHLRSVRERVAVGGELITPADFGRLAGETRALTAGDDATSFRTYFETVLAVALLYFGEREVDVAVLETGLGGRLDATNVVTPAVVVITSLGLDHTEILGDAVAAVAREKAGIVKPGVPAVSAPQPAEALAVIEEVAAPRAAPLTVVGRDVTFRPGDGAFNYAGPRYHIENIRPAMAGPAQAVNGAVALAALELFHAFDVAAAAARAGVETARLRARLELIPGSPPTLLDVAHNADSARELAREITRVGRKPVIMAWGMSEDKDAAAFARELIGVVDAVVATAAPSPRAVPPTRLAAAARGVFKNIEEVETPRAALARARALAGPEGLVVIAGSFYLAGEIMTLIEGSVP